MSKRKSQKKSPKKIRRIGTISANAHNKTRNVNRGLHRWEFIACLLLISATFAVYWQVHQYDFLNFDDYVYVAKNPVVQAGLTSEGFVWAFTTSHASNWHPLTWLSHMLDCQLFGLNAKVHHLFNVLFHIANAVLLFFLFRRMTTSPWRSAFVAALFALHPLHVESVAWVAERKDVLSTLFWILTIWAYIRYVERPGVNRYLLTLFTFALGLMAKPMLVTLPFVLLLLDYWPLDRFQVKQSDVDTSADLLAFPRLKEQMSLFSRLIWEKIPFFALSAVSSVVTLYVQKSGVFVGALEAYPIKIRIANALVSYVSYMGKMIWPRSLAVLYPHPGYSLPMWQATLAGLLLVFISITVIRAARRHPYFLAGWLWYLGTLVPVIGLVQVGFQGMADRYTYVPLIGLFIMISWAIPDLVTKSRYPRIAVKITAVSILAVLMILTWLQVKHWKSSITLFEHTLNVTTHNYVAHHNLGVALYERGRLHEAISHYTQALQIKPDYAEAYSNSGIALARRGNFKEAIAHFSQALQIKPDYAEAHSNLGIALARQGNLKRAIDHFSQALQIKPDYAEAHSNLGIALARQGNLKRAIDHFYEAVRNRPDYAEAHSKLGIALARQGNLKEAIDHFSEAVRINPNLAEVHNNLGAILARQGNFKEAIAHFSQAVRINPNYIEARRNLNRVMRRIGKSSGALNSANKP